VTNSTTSPSSWTTLAAVLLGIFVGTLANSVSNVALPAVMREFEVPLASGMWVVTLYTLLFAVLMPVCGYLGDLYGQRRMYLVGMALFILASLGSGLAPTFPCLLVARVLQGIAVAPILPAVMAMIGTLFPSHQRGRAMGFWALTNGAGHALGPPLSGFLTEAVGWRAVFLVTVPLSLISLYAVWRVAPPDGGRSRRGFDWLGAVTLTAAALGLMLALNWGARFGWSSWRSLALWGLTLLGLVVFIATERRVQVPFVDLRLFRNRPYAAAIAVIGAQVFSQFGLLLVLPVFLIQVQGVSSGAAGLLILPLPLALALISPLAGRLADRRGSRWVCTLGMALVAVMATALWVGLGRGEGLPAWAIVVGLAGVGAGMGLTQSPTAMLVTQVVEKERLGVATGIFHMGRFLSGTLGTTAFGLILQAYHERLALGFQRDLLAVVIVAGVALLISRRLPG
jgi:EmrB/QacA subfamily drug resistance transporter